MDRIDTLQSLFRFFFPGPLGEKGLRNLENSLQKALGLKWAALFLLGREGPRRKDRKGVTAILEAELSRKTNPGPRRTGSPVPLKKYKAFLWPLWVQGRQAGFYALGPRTDGKPLPSGDKTWMELLAERTSSYLTERKLWQSLESAHRQSTTSLLSAAMLHEIRNPLTALSTLIQLFPQKKGDARFLESFEKVVPREISRLHQVTQDLLDLSKPTGEDRSVVCLGDVLDHLAALLKPHFKTKNVELTIRHEPGLYLEGNRQRIEILVLNLLQNAFQSVGKGGRVEVRARKVAVRNGRSGHQVHLEVRDDGKGISPADMDRIREPFFSTQPGGIGLGLAITQRILQDHGGNMTVKNTPKGGVSFSLIFPGTSTS